MAVNEGSSFSLVVLGIEDQQVRELEHYILMLLTVHALVLIEGEREGRKGGGEFNLRTTVKEACE